MRVNKVVTNMSRVDFYILADNETQLLPFACRLLSKAYQQQHHIHVYTEDDVQARKLDTLLWTYQDISFVPHALADSEIASSAPILIGETEAFSDTADILVNLKNTLPDKVDAFQRIIEIVPHAEPWLGLSRKKYAAYRDLNCQLHNHRM